MSLLPQVLEQLGLQTCVATPSYQCVFRLLCEAPLREKEVLSSSTPFQPAALSHLLKDLEFL